MNGENEQKQTSMRQYLKGTNLFPILVLVLYVILFLSIPDKAWPALKNSVSILQSLLIPLCLVFGLMFLINLFLNPAKVAKYLGGTSGLKGAVLSAVAGVISVGPIYAWYPLLKDLKEKGAADSSIAIFLNNRAVKPFLLPIMIAYFGLQFVIVLTVLMIVASFAIGYLLSIFMGINEP
jgi:uncharacterized membrane protein YraQ (UPF0718 family)